MPNKSKGFLAKWWWVVGVGLIMSIGGFALQTNMRPKPLLESIQTGSIVRDDEAAATATKREQR